MEKTLHNSDASGTSENVPDVQFFSALEGDDWKLLCKASSQAQGWMKSTKAMEIDGVGALVQVTTQQRNPDGSYSVSEAVTFVPKVRVKPKVGADGKVYGRVLVGIK